MAARTASPAKPARATKPVAKAAPKPRRSAPDRPAPAEDLINGQVVVKVEPVLSGLTGRGGVQISLRFDKLTLADGTECWRCADCKHIAESRGAAQNHRSEAHPNPKNARRRDRAEESAREQVLAMGLGEVVELAMSGVRAVEIVEEMRQEMMAARMRAVEAEAKVNRFKTAMARLGFRLEEDE